MFELWAKRITTRRYEYITSFDDERQKFYMMDRLDRNIYSEAMILNNQQCTMYREFEKPLVRSLKK